MIYLKRARLKLINVSYGVASIEKIALSSILKLIKYFLSLEIMYIIRYPYKMLHFLEYFKSRRTVHTRGLYKTAQASAWLKKRAALSIRRRFKHYRDFSGCLIFCVTPLSTGCHKVRDAFNADSARIGKRKCI